MAAANWKMNLTPETASALARSVKQAAPDISGVEFVLCPPAVYISSVAQIVQNSPVSVGGQDLYWEAEGAFTGAISGSMLRHLGCRYCIVGHSERRQLFKETDEEVKQKVIAAHRTGLIPIFCVGETRPLRESGRTREIVSTQLRKGLEGVSLQDGADLVIAYEPIWAIGTGLTATPAQAEEVHQFIRELVCELFGSNPAQNIRILYGGSVKPENIQGLMAEPNIDGALIGGASLKGDSYLAIARGCQGIHR